MCNSKLNNKGFSLIELLVAMAIGSIVLSAVLLLLTQGLKGYTKQTLTSQLEDEANLALNQISDAIMEADCIKVSSDTGNYSLVTKDSTTTYEYNATDHKVYLTTIPGASGSLVCSHVDEFEVDAITTTNPVRIKVTLTLKAENVTRTVTRTTNVRNKISTVTINGF